MHGKSTDPAYRSDMGGGTDRAGRGAARSWERQRKTTGTALAAGLLVLGTLVLLRHRWDTDVATSTVGKTAPGATDVAAGRSAHTVSPVGAKENRHGSAEWFSSAHSRPTDDCVSYDECRTHVESRETPCMGSASGSDGAAQGAGEPHAGTGTGNGTGKRASERAGQDESRGGGMPQPRNSVKGNDNLGCKAQEQPGANDGFVRWHKVCNDSLYDSFDVMKFWCHKSSGGYPVIVTICLAAIVICGKTAPWVTGGTGNSRWTRKVSTCGPTRYPGATSCISRGRRLSGGKRTWRRRDAGSAPSACRVRCRCACKRSADADNGRIEEVRSAVHNEDLINFDDGESSECPTCQGEGWTETFGCALCGPNVSVFLSPDGADRVCTASCGYVCGSRRSLADCAGGHVSVPSVSQ